MSDEDTDNDQEMESSNNDTITEQFNKHQFETNLKQCRDALSQNPNDYTTHLNLVNALSNIKYINQFRKARDKMCNKFAIPPSVSINFINVEMEYLYYLSNDKTPTIQQINIIIQLFKNAINDYCIDIKLWTNYLSFVFQFKSIIGLNEIRKNIINQAVKTIGQHFYDGHTFWSLYREFETENLANLVSKQSKDDTPDIEDIDGINSDSEHDTDIANVSVTNQTELIRKIWIQQINICHFQIEDTYRNYQEWECALYGQSSNKYKDKYNQSKKLNKYFKKYELELSKLEPNISDGYASIQRLEFWKKYINNIRNNIKNISHKIILNLYERAILDCFLFEQQWIDYINYIKEKGLKYEIVNICERSVRNIPLSVPLWLEYIYGCEWSNMDCEEINKRIFNRFVFEKGKNKCKKEDIVSLGDNIDGYVSIGIAKCEYYRRRAECAISDRYDDNESKNDNNELIKEAQSVFGELEILIDANINNRWTPTFYTFYTDFLARFVGNINKARNLWEKLIRQRGKEWNLWVLFIEWESNFGELEPVIPSKNKLLNTNNFNILNKRHGHKNIFQIRKLYHKAMHVLTIDNGLQYIGEKYLLFERICGDLQSLYNAQIKFNKQLKLEKNRKKQNEEKRLQTKKRKRDINQNEKNIQITKHKHNNNDIKAPAKKRVRFSDNDKDKKMNNTNMKVKRQTNDPNFIDISEKGSREERTVFIVNFRKTMSRKDIGKLFGEFGKLENIKLPIDKYAKHNSKLKGFGYIEYRHKENALACINELNGKSIQGKVLRVERYRNKNNNTNTVYIKGLNKNMNQIEGEKCIKNILNKCGEIKEIRLTKDKNKLKGFGYVEFVKYESVEK
eukprot:479949_1